jgi:hypothetical protein
MKYKLFFDGHQKGNEMTLVAARSLALAMANKAVRDTRNTYTFEQPNILVVHDALYTHHVIKITEA